MFRLHKLSFAAFLLALPVAALAAYNSPSELLAAMTYDGTPREFEGKMSFHSGDMHMAGWLSGEMEGTDSTDRKGDMRITIDLAEDEMWTRLRFQVRVFMKNTYIRLEEFQTAYNDEMLDVSLQAMQKQWVKMTDDTGMLDMHGSAVTGLTMGLSEAGVPLSQYEMGGAVYDMVDEIFMMEHTRFNGGRAYSLTMTPEAMRDMDLRNAKMHIKVNTTDEGGFQWGKLYFGASDEAADTEIGLELSMQKKVTPVYIDIPQNTTTLDQLMRYLDHQNIFNQYDLDMFSPDAMWPNQDNWSEENLYWYEEDTDDWMMDDWSEEDDTDWNWTEQDDWNWEEDDTDTYVPQTEIDSRTRLELRRQQRLEERQQSQQPDLQTDVNPYIDDLRTTGRPRAVRGSINCNVPKDSAQYLYLKRKGLCNGDTSLHRVNNTSSPKQERYLELEEERKQEYRQKWLDLQQQWDNAQ